MILFNLSENLNHTWFIDLDGTIFEHNSYLSGEDVLLPGVTDIWSNIPIEDFIIIVTSRTSNYKELTLKSLNKFNLRFNHIIFDLPLGERILINDVKPGGLECAIAHNVERNKGFK